jgi:hypothetical protein
MLQQVHQRGQQVRYVVADANFDTADLHKLCTRLGGQLIAPRKKSNRGKGTRKWIPAGRRRSIDATETDLTGSGASLLKQRRQIEATFGTLETRFGLSRLPWHVRGLHTVIKWTNAAVALGIAIDNAKAQRAA